VQKAQDRGKELAFPLVAQAQRYPRRKIMNRTIPNAEGLQRIKFSRPRRRSDLVPRPRLLECLNAGLSSNLTLLCAPAGFGKTTLLVEWLETTQYQSAWLTLERGDNEISAFVHALVSTLRTVFPNACPATASLLQGPQFPPPDRVASLLLNDLADLSIDTVLVLDEYHVINNISIHHLLELLINQLPPQIHLLLATRADPPFPLAIWRAQGRLNELRSVDLRFTLQETRHFLTGVLGYDLACEAAEKLEERTEGWIAMLRLAAFSLRSISDHTAFIEHLNSYPDDSMSSYMVQEVLDQQAPAVQELLVRTSFLKLFSAELCAITIDSDVSPIDVQATLNWLENANVFLVSLDDHHEWYSYHHLFRPLLQQRLRERVSREEVAALHQRAIAWYSDRGLIDQALDQAITAGEAHVATQLVEAQFFRAFEQEQLVQVERWLRLLPEEQVQNSPILLVAKVWVLQARGQLKDLPHLLWVARRLLGNNGNKMKDLDDTSAKLLYAFIGIAWSHVQFFTGQIQVSLKSARSAIEWLPPGEEHIMSSIALLYLALSNQAIGRGDVALSALRLALREQATRPTTAARLLFAQALVYLAAGKLPQVEETARHLLQFTSNAHLLLSQNFAHWLLGVVHYEWNNLEAAIYHFSEVIASRHHAHFWAVRDAMCGLALAYQAQGLSNQAQDTTRTLLEWVQEQHNIQELLTAHAYQGQLALLQGEVESAEQWIEMAGDQVIQGPMIFIEEVSITRAWMLLAKGDEASVVQGQALLTRLLQHTETIHCRRKTIQILALQALACDQQGQTREALERLELALVLGRQGGFIRTFADLPSLVKLLQELRKSRKIHQEVDRKLDTYLRDILVAMRSMGVQTIAHEELMRQEGLEALTSRELQILGLLDKGFTNKEIAHELVVTPGTVKVHTHSIYRKLSVSNRRAAVTLAKALGLLATDLQTYRPID
jgi:LuxR family maltose regulon positive regulatory protein